MTNFFTKFLLAFIIFGGFNYAQKIFSGYPLDDDEYYNTTAIKVVFTDIINVFFGNLKEKIELVYFDNELKGFQQDVFVLLVDILKANSSYLIYNQQNKIYRNVYLLFPSIIFISTNESFQMFSE